MAVYTEVTAEDLDALLERYSIGPLRAFKGIAEGVENSNYFLGTGCGQYILTLYEKRVKADELPFFLGLMQHLAKSGIQCPTPVADRFGHVRQTLCGRPAAIVTFLTGYSLRKPKVQHCQALGTSLAALHKAGSDFEGKRRNTLSVQGWRDLLCGLNGSAERIVNGIGPELKDELSALQDNWPGDLPQGIIHADLFPDNVLFLKDDISGLIDFYFACNDILAYDIAICLNAWCFETDLSFNVTKAKALLRGYNQVRPLMQAEIQALPLLSRGAAMRFLLTRMYDWLNTPEGALVKPKDPLEYWRKLRFHQTVSSASAYGF